MFLAVLWAFVSGQYSDTVFWGIVVTAFGLILGFMTGTLTTVLQVRMQMKWASLPLVLGKIVSSGYMVGALLAGLPFVHLLLAGVLGNLVVLFFTYRAVARETEIFFACDVQYWKQLFVTAFPYGLSLILSTLYFRLDAVMLFQMKTSHEVGLYGVPLRVLEIANIIPVIFLNTVLPTMTRFAGENKLTELRQVLQKSWDVLTVLSFGMAAFVIALPGAIILFVASKDFAESALPLSILMVGLVFSFLNSLFSFLLIAYGKQARMLIVNAFVLLFKAISNWYLIPLFGIVGVSITSSLAEGIVLVATYFIICRYFEPHLSLVNTFKIFICALGLAFTAFFVYSELFAILGSFAVAFALAAVCSGLVYVVLLFALRAVTKSEILSLLGR